MLQLNVHLGRFTIAKQWFDIIYLIRSVTMGSAEMFSLKWNDYLPAVSETFRRLRQDEALCDVTLVCDDDEVEAHRIVLVASSAFFQKIFSKQRGKNNLPLVYLRGVKMCQVLSVLDFMYCGEVNISQQDLSDFLSLARDLQIKGINLPAETENNKEVYSPPSNSSSQLLESHSMSSNLLQSSDLLSCPSYEEINGMPKPQLAVKHSGSSIGSHEYQVIADPEIAAVTPLSDSMMHFEAGVWICHKCGKSDKNKHNLRDHTDTHLTLSSPSFPCSYCGKFYKTKNSLRVHKYKIHGGEKLLQQLSYVV